MRTKLILFSIFITGLCFAFLMPSMNMSLSQYREYKVLKEQISTLSDKKGDISETEEKSYQYNKKSVTNAIAEQGGCEITQVSALMIDGSGDCSVIASSENLDAVNNFGDEANCIEYTVKAEYPSNFLNFLEKQDYVIDSVSYNLQNGEIVVRILFLNGGASPNE